MNNTTTPGQAPHLAIDGRVATITLRRPAVANRLELEDLQTLQAQVDEVNAGSAVLVLRLVAEGRHFCSGFNIGQVGSGANDAGQRFEALAAAVERARPVTIAAIQGGVYGGATDLALACDFRIGTPASELSVPAAKLGLLFYRGGLERWVTRLGLATAKRVLLTADKLDADAMLSCGYLDRLAPSVEALQPSLDELTTTLAGMAPLALLGMKKHLNRIAAGTLIEDELARDIGEADASADLREGALAWQQKRGPVFHGR
jgi:enoyl-CoA hydratase/carnithine racemase